MHSEFDKLQEMLRKIDRDVGNIAKADSSSGTPGSKITRKYYTTRQYQQPNSSSSQNSGDSQQQNPFGGQSSSGFDPVSSSLQNAQMDASLSGNPKPPVGGSYYASPISTTIEPIGQNNGIPPPPGGNMSSNSNNGIPGMPPPPNSGPQNSIPKLGENGLGKSSDNKSGGFSLFKK